VDSSKAQHFQAILQLLQLVGALMPGDEHKHHGDKLTRDTRRSFDFVDAITNLMVRDDEVVAAVACGGRLPTQGIISINSPSETPSHENAQVRPHVLIYLLFLKCQLQIISPIDFQGVPDSADFTLLSSSKPKTDTFWTVLEKCKSEDVILRCVF
jgi:hypothetical protein